MKASRRCFAVSSAANDGGVLTNDAHDGYSDYSEISAPAGPAANTARLYAKDKSGVAEYFFGRTQLGAHDLEIEVDGKVYSLDNPGYVGGPVPTPNSPDDSANFIQTGAFVTPLSKGTHDLTIRGVTREVVLDVEYAGQSKSPWGQTSAGFTATTQINRKDWGLGWNQVLESGGLLVGDEINVEIELEIVKQAEEAVKLDPNYATPAEQSPNYAWAYYDRGFAYLKRKHYKSAIADFTKAAAINNANFMASANIDGGNPVILTKNTDFLTSEAVRGKLDILPDPAPAPWTDDYASIWPLLSYWKKH